MIVKGLFITNCFFILQCIYLIPQISCFSSKASLEVLVHGMRGIFVVPYLISFYIILEFFIILSNASSLLSLYAVSVVFSTVPSKLYLNSTELVSLEFLIWYCIGTLLSFHSFLLAHWFRWLYFWFCPFWLFSWFWLFQWSFWLMIWLSLHFLSTKWHDLIF